MQSVTFGNIGCNVQNDKLGGCEVHLTLFFLIENQEKYIYIWAKAGTNNSICINHTHMLTVLLFFVRTGSYAKGRTTKLGKNAEEGRSRYDIP